MGTPLTDHLPDAEHTDVHPCPYCGAENDAATGLRGARNPGAGDLSVCVRCYNIGVFTTFLGRLKVRQITHDELVKAEADPEMGDLLKKVRALADARR